MPRGGKPTLKQAGGARPKVPQPGARRPMAATPKPKARKRAAAAAPAPPAAPAPAPAAPTQPGGYNVSYNPTIEDQLNQSIQDAYAEGAGRLYQDFNDRMGGLGDMYDRYRGMAGGAMDNYGGNAAAMAGLGGNYLNQGGMTLGDYGALSPQNLAIQQGIGQNIQDIQAGKADFDPFLNQQFADEERLLREQLQRNLGGDYETSSAGIEALSKFNQRKTATLGNAQFNRLGQLYDMQQRGRGGLAEQAINFGQQGGGFQNQQYQQMMGLAGGQQGSFGDIASTAFGLRDRQLTNAGRMLDNTQNRMGMMTSVPTQMANFGNNLGQYGSNALGATAPYQRDREMEFRASFAPTEGQMWGNMAGQSGDRWVQVGGQMMGGR